MTNARGHSFNRRTKLMSAVDNIYWPDNPDVAVHSFFHCPRWKKLRLDGATLQQHSLMLTVDHGCAKIMEANGNGNWNCIG